MSYPFKKSASQLTALGSSTSWVKIPTHATLNCLITPDTASSVVVRLEYNSDATPAHGDAVDASSQDITIIDGSVPTAIAPSSSAGQYVRLRWISGTATTLDTDFLIYQN